MALKAVSPSDAGDFTSASHREQVIELGNRWEGSWLGFAKLVPGVTYVSADITFPSDQRGVPDRAGCLIYANSYVKSVGINISGDITLGAATGKIKFATALNAATSGLYVESPAAISNLLAQAVAFPNNANGYPTPTETFNATAVTIGNSNLTYKLYATDGVAGAGAGASTFTVAVPTWIDVRISFWAPPTFPPRDVVGISPPSN